MKQYLTIVSSRENFLLRMLDDGAYETHSDLVAKGATRSGQAFRLVMESGARMRKPRPGRARAVLLRYVARRNAGLSPRDADDIYLEALRADRAKHIWFTKLRLRAWGLLRYQWRYGRI